jgi:hypothetical protein
MFRFLSLISFSCATVLLVISGETCVDLMEDHEGKVGQDQLIPAGYSLTDLLTVKGELNELSRKLRRTFLIFKHQGKSNPVIETIMRSTLSSSQHGKLEVKTPEGHIVFTKSGIMQADGNSFLLQMRCHRTKTTCHVTSQSNTTVEYFYYDRTRKSDDFRTSLQDVSELLSTNRIGVGKNYSELSALATLQTITFCKATEPRIEIEVRPAEPPIEGKTYTLVCRVTGLPVISATWSKDGVELRDTVRELEDSNEEQALKLTYTIGSMSSEDIGYYTCRGRSLLVSEQGVLSGVQLGQHSCGEYTRRIGDHYSDLAK